MNCTRDDAEDINAVIASQSRGCAVDPSRACLYIHVEKSQDVHLESEHLLRRIS